MSFDPTWLFLSLIPGAIGMVLLGYGKKQGRWPHMVAGLLLLVYPSFTPSVVALVVTGSAIGGALWYVNRLGW
ncbi:MAG: amino acid transport protein [Vicinamibacterales bacterium]